MDTEKARLSTSLGGGSRRPICWDSTLGSGLEETSTGAVSDRHDASGLGKTEDVQMTSPCMPAGVRLPLAWGEAEGLAWRHAGPSWAVPIRPGGSTGLVGGCGCARGPWSRRSLSRAWGLAARGRGHGRVARGFRRSDAGPAHRESEVHWGGGGAGVKRKKHVRGKGGLRRAAVEQTGCGRIGVRQMLGGGRV